MLGLAQQAGHELTRNASEADVLVVNTCAFIDSAKQESIDTILEMAQYKTRGACTRLVVTGCMAERYRDALIKEIPEIDAVLGTGEVPDIVRAIGAGARLQAVPSAPAPLQFFRTNASTVSEAASTLSEAASTLSEAGNTLSEAAITSRSRPTYLYGADTPRLLATPRHYAYIKIAEGCDYKCAFCIIPTLRGAYRSRSSDSILREARMLAAQGVKELLLISQDTTFYGNDRQERGALARLLRELNAVDGLAWIRLLYLYPTTIDDGTLAAMAECEKVCKYVDLPLQHASNPVLKRMRRPGTRQGYDALLARIRERVPGVALRTTFIVGFPGEAESDVDELCAFVRDQTFDHVGVFTYSHEDGTSAFHLPDDVPARAKATRRARVMRLQKGLVRTRQQARIGQRARIVVDGPSSDHDLVLKGRLMTQAPDIDAVVYLTECDPSSFKAGDFTDVDIVDAREYDLIARPVL
jgi:ribosomal protein S12 methylthiotransferase